MDRFPSQINNLFLFLYFLCFKKGIFLKFITFIIDLLFTFFLENTKIKLDNLTHFS